MKTRPRITYNMTGFRGVFWDATGGGRFNAEIGSYRNGTLRRLGHFKTAREAAEAYDNAALDLYGPDAVLNFPLNGHATFNNAPPVVPKQCVSGHEYPKHSYISPSGRIYCRECNRLAAQRYAQRKRSIA